MSDTKKVPFVGFSLWLLEDVFIRQFGNGGTFASLPLSAKKVTRKRLYLLSCQQIYCCVFRFSSFDVPISLHPFFGVALFRPLLHVVVLGPLFIDWIATERWNSAHTGWHNGQWWYCYWCGYSVRRASLPLLLFGVRYAPIAVVSVALGTGKANLNLWCERICSQRSISPHCDRTHERRK